jgi:hypothetical protein
MFKIHAVIKLSILSHWNFYQVCDIWGSHVSTDVDDVVLSCDAVCTSPHSITTQKSNSDITGS